MVVNDKVKKAMRDNKQANQLFTELLIKAVKEDDVVKSRIWESIKDKIEKLKECDKIYRDMLVIKKAPLDECINYLEEITSNIHSLNTEIVSLLKKDKPSLWN